MCCEFGIAEKLVINSHHCCRLTWRGSRAESVGEGVARPKGGEVASEARTGGRHVPATLKPPAKRVSGCILGKGWSPQGDLGAKPRGRGIAAGLLKTLKILVKRARALRFLEPAPLLA